MGAACSGVQARPVELHSDLEVSSAMSTRTTRAMGWIPDEPDFRDLVLQLPEQSAAKLPHRLDLRNSDRDLPIMDQGQLGSCVGAAISSALHHDMVKHLLGEFSPSPLFIYHNARAFWGGQQVDGGARIRDGLKVAHKIGFCSEASWPYAINNFKGKPNSDSYTEAWQHKARHYARVPQNLTAMKACLNSGVPFIVGFTLFSSFRSQENYATGMMPMPETGDSIEGGHAVLVLGYDDAIQRFLARNSWGADWGDAGYFWMPYAFITKKFFAKDLWVVRHSSGEPLPTTFITDAAEA